MPEPERLGCGDVDAAAALLARAFADDPVLTFLLGEGRERERRLIYGALCRDVAGAGLIEGVRAEVRLVPGAPPSWGMRTGVSRT